MTSSKPFGQGEVHPEKFLPFLVFQDSLKRRGANSDLHNTFSKGLSYVVVASLALILSLTTPSIAMASPMHETKTGAETITQEDFLAMTDDELAGVNAGVYDLQLPDFNVVLQNNEAGMFSLDISQEAFNGARGLFTTLQAVNSAVDLTVIVNIYLNGQQL